MENYMKTIPLIKPDLPPFEELEVPFREILDNGRITNFGKYVTQFEQEAGAYLGTQTLTVSSGTLGMVLTLQALGLQPGQKVILPSFTFMATAQAVRYVGAVPLFAEIDEDMTISPADLEQLLARHDDVGVVLPVHAYGLPCHVDEIQQIVDAAAQRRSQPIAVLYDAAHAFGSALNDRKAGSFGNAEVFSLSVTKLLVSVEGGMVSSKDADLIQRIRKMRNYGIEENYNAFWPGMNGKMSEFHAIVGLHNLRRVDDLLAEREQKARYYLQRIETRTHFGTLPWPAGVKHTFKDFTVLLPQTLSDKRDAVISFLKEQGVETRAYFFPPVHEQRLFQQYTDRPLPRTEFLARQVITLPFFTSIGNDEIDYVVEALAAAERSLA
jgi:dTDP-4-amino-4,6-dideoxygalactose transaminase